MPAELTAGHWDRASGLLAAKMVAELCFEYALVPEADGPGRWSAAVGAARYRFEGRRTLLDGWRVLPGVTRVGADGTEAPASPFALLRDLGAAGVVDPAVEAFTVGELTATLSADARLAVERRTAADLADLPYADLEGHQTGHPWIFANKGRVGFSARDRADFPPEARRPVRLPWIAVHRSLAEYHGVPGLEEEVLRARELGGETVARFTGRLAAAGADPDAFVWLPVHPWQWDEVVVPLFAAELARGLIVPLGEAGDDYLPQQSIRTFTNLTRPDRFNVKLSLAILNTMVYRGIPTELCRAAPVSTGWVHALHAKDAFLAERHRVILPGEVAAVAVRHPVLEDIPDAPYRHRQLLGALWREPVAGFLEPGERARTLAALLHVDGEGRAFTAELVERSGLDAEEWLAALFGTVLPPLLHLLYRYGLAFNPHGENTIVVYDERDRPVRLAVKDFVDDMKLLDADLPEYEGLPAEALGVLMRFDARELTSSVAKSLFIGHFRYLAPLAEEQLGVGEERFWALVRAEIDRYRAEFPELADRFALFDLLAPEYERVCLNRERLLGGGYHDRAERDAEFHLDAPPVPNPLHTPEEKR
ncbi:IucA/IucC family siderophore biosynthesis protein [Nocardiopsis sp. MT53]|uniref:IucA/IucC family siderophore biosynthesis protein n=1 Tax=Nocardiopsis changdeensis TaxID=2831969 RepID=A0ABX8BV09_9ACTN|nr:IucA/IucC family siderophore biosynthesis protein [Nocardiopsis changdeensis]QYX40387.1 IucA/IucC family siderophore biosynthesis protein [Nocardiopsis sp. MT53]